MKITKNKIPNTANFEVIFEMLICFANRDDWFICVGSKVAWQSPEGRKVARLSPAVPMVDVEHHDGHILVLVVKLPRLVVELGLHLSSGSLASSHRSATKSKGLMCLYCCPGTRWARDE